MAISGVGQAEKGSRCVLGMESSRESSARTCPSPHSPHVPSSHPTLFQPYHFLWAKLINSQTYLPLHPAWKTLESLCSCLSLLILQASPDMSPSQKKLDLAVALGQAKQKSCSPVTPALLLLLAAGLRVRM